jgi:hypothetical protein
MTNCWIRQEKSVIIKTGVFQVEIRHRGKKFVETQKKKKKKIATRIKKTGAGVFFLIQIF